MYSPRYEPLNGPHMFWYDALDLPGANQMRYVRRLIESHPMLDRIPDQSIIVEGNNTPAERIQAARGKDYIVVYTAQGKPFTVLADKISGNKLNACWFNPRNGKTEGRRLVDNHQSNIFTPPTTGYGQDWVLVLDDARVSYSQL